MRTIITEYTCNNCGKLLPKRHLSLNFGGWSGFVEPNKEGVYRHIKNAVRPEGDIKQLCNMKCLKAYFLKDNKRGE